MKNNNKIKSAKIFIKSKQSIGKESAETVEIFTKGSFYKIGETYYLIYNEFIANSSEKRLITLTATNEKTITLLKIGDNDPEILLEKGKRYICYYNTISSNIFLGIYCNQINNSLSEEGGTLSFKYSIDINSLTSSYNEVKIQIIPSK